jgi:hypothetical protein
LDASADLPSRVTRGRRAIHLLILSALLLASGGCLTFGAGIGMTAVVPGTLQTKIRQIEGARDALVKGTELQFAASAFNPDPGLRLTALGLRQAQLQLADQLQQLRERYEEALQIRLRSSRWYARASFEAAEAQAQKTQDKSSDLNDFHRKAVGLAQSTPAETMREVLTGTAFVGSVFLGFWPLLWIIWAFAFRGGITFPVLGIAVVRADGRKARRIACAWRAFLVWSLVYALLAGSFFVEAWLWKPEAAATWVSWLSEAMWWLGLLLLPLYAALAIWYPERSLHDRLAGTYLVPK